LFSVYVPTLLFAIGQGAVIPVIPLLAKEIGASLAAVGFIVAMRGIGTMAFDIPAGTLVGRFGEKKTVVVGTAMLAVSSIGCILSGTPAAIAAFVFVMGCGWSVWLLARLSFVSDVVPPEHRGRALSTLGGVNRMGNFVGPFLGAAAVAVGGLEAAFFIQLAAGVAACVLLVAVPDVELGHAEASVRHAVPFRAIIRDHRRTYSTAGVAASCVSLLRAARQVVIPLWGVKLGLPAPEIAMIFGISSGLDMLLFYPSGLVCDRVGRKSITVSCLVVLSAGLLALPFAHSGLGLVLVALLLGAGNGIGTGIVMILGADFSPPRGKAEFLGVWRLVSDLGQAGGPLVIAGIAGAASLGFASVSVGALGLAGAAFVARFVPETLVKTALVKTRPAAVPPPPVPPPSIPHIAVLPDAATVQKVSSGHG
jgi:MFS family permease